MESTHGRAVHEVQVSLQVPNKYYVFIFLVFLRVVMVNNSRCINHMETEFNEYHDDLSYQYVRASHFSEVIHKIWQFCQFV